MFLAFATLALGRVDDDSFALGRAYRADSFVKKLEDCDCGWVTIPGACSNDDGSVCWKVCCHPGPAPNPGPTPPPVNPGDWKPVDLVQEYMLADAKEGQKLSKAMANGFSRQGGMRYHSAQKLDLVGGGLQFTVDVSQVKNLVNANLYLVIPGTLDGGSHFYCDNSENFVNQGNACIELDIFETNGHSLAASTMHTYIGTGTGGCDTWGCRGMINFGQTIDGNRPFQVNVDVGNDGDLKVRMSQDGKTQYAFNNVGGFDAGAKAAIADGMRNHGAIVVSSMWTGWVPPNTSGQGDLGGSHYTLSNLLYKGSSKGNTVA